MPVTLAVDEDFQLARQLRQSWDAFFARFGRLTEVQRQAIPPILQGRDVLVSAPTAAGKTEAVCAPLIERLVSQPRGGTILYVCPTRALVNDLFERLQTPLLTMGLRLARRTGDHHDRVSDLVDLLITTPESFDSLLCRGRTSPNGHVLAGVRAIVLDEIHLLHNTPRGEQLRWLIERLRRLKAYGMSQGWVRTAEFQRVALSATVAAPEDVVTNFLQGGDSVLVAGSREIEVVFAPAETPSVEDQLPAYVDGLLEPEKILVFCNRRLRVDRLALDLRGPLEARGYLVRAHHGSLSKEEREAAERDVKTQDRVIVFATSTLEIGIDIGDIDLVVLDGPAPDVASLLQRVGRGNRRSGKTRVMLCAGSAGDVLIQSAMLSAARAGDLPRVESGPQFAVSRQQIASFIFQGSTRARRRDTISALVNACLPDVDAAHLLNHFIATAQFDESGDGIRLGEEWLDATRRGEVHSTIESLNGTQVVDRDTGQAIAHGVREQRGDGLGVAGKLLRVTERTDWALFVNRVRDPKLASGLWSYVSRAWVQGAGQPQAVRRYLGFQENEWPWCYNGSHFLVFHFGGVRRRAVLSLLNESASAFDRAAEFTPWTLSFSFGPPKVPSWIEGATPALLTLTVPKHVESLERSLARPRANSHLPVDLRVREVQEWLDIDHELAVIQEASWTEPEDAQRDGLLMLARMLAQPRMADGYDAAGRTRSHQ